MIVEAGFGDGVYPVEVRYFDHPSLGTRVAEVRVRFIDDDVVKLVEEDRVPYIQTVSVIAHPVGR